MHDSLDKVSFSVIMDDLVVYVPQICGFDLALAV